MLITKFDPFKQIRELEKSFYNYPSNEGVSGFVPVVNTREADNAFHIDVDLPGVKKDDIKVDLQKDRGNYSVYTKHFHFHKSICLPIIWFEILFSGNNYSSII